MHSVNLDLLHATAAHYPDGRAKDPHAHHLAEHLAALRAGRRARRRAALLRALAFLSARPAKPTPRALAESHCP